MPQFTYRGVGASDCSVIGTEADAIIQVEGSVGTLVAYTKGLIAEVAGTAGVVSYPTAAAPANGVSLAAALSATYNASTSGVGTLAFVQKTVAATAFVTGGAAFTVASSGRFYVENLIMSCDSGSVTTATNLEIVTDNASGPAILLAEAIANVTASKGVDLSTASVAKQRVVLESGKVLSFKATGAGAAGAGNITMTAVLRRMDAAATISAA